MRKVSTSTLQDMFGGTKRSGRAVAPDGERLTGTYLTFGPASYFVPDRASAAAGPAFRGEDSPLRTIYGGLSSESEKAVRAFAEGADEPLPFDPTLGDAARLAESRKGVVAHLKQGRITIIPLLLLGAACVFFAVYKFIALVPIASRRADDTIMEILNALHREDTETAERHCKALSRPLCSVIREGIRHRNAPKDQLEEIMREQMLSQTPSLERFLSPLAVCASAAPLLGLLGTVTGMIHTFRLITVFGSGRANVLSSGISEALVTTEVGLIIAVPALLLHAYFSRRVRRALALTRQAAVTFVNGLQYVPAEQEHNTT